LEKIYDLERFESIQNLRGAIRRKDQSERTYRNYLIGINSFMSVLEISDLDGVIAQIKAGEADSIALLKDYVDHFVPSQINGKWKIKRKTLRLYVAGLKRLLRTNDVRIYSEDVRELLPRTVRQPKGEGPRKDRMMKLLQNVSLRGKIILTLASGSGLRMGTIVKLQIRDLFPNYPDLNDPNSQQKELLLKVPYATEIDGEPVRKMKGALTEDPRIFYGFVTPQATQLITWYLDERKRSGEHLTLDSPLLTLDKIDGVHGKGPGDFLTYDSAWRAIRKGLKKSGLVTRKHERNKFYPHSFRAYFRTALLHAGVSQTYAEMLMAHEGGYLQDRYIFTEIDKLREAYVKALPHLELKERAIAELDHEVNKLRRENEELRSKIERRRKEDDKRIADLERRIIAWEKERPMIQAFLEKSKKLLGED